MRQTAARLNRGWLTVIGTVLLLAGLAGLLVSLDLVRPAAQAVGIQVVGPDRDSRVFGVSLASAMSSPWVIVLIGLAGAVVGLLGLAWLAAQVPRSNQAKPFRLHDDPRTGMTRVAPGVLSAAVAAQTKALPGVQDASVVLRGTAAAPEVTVKVTANDRADLIQLLAALQNQVAPDAGASLDTELRRFAVQVEIDTTKTTSDHITIPARAAI